MNEYQTKIQKFEEYECDQEGGEHFAGYITFSTVHVGKQTQARTTKQSQSGKAASPTAKQWWAEYCFQIKGCEVRANLTKHNLTQAAAIRKAEEMAELINGKKFVQPEDATVWMRPYVTGR